MVPLHERLEIVRAVDHVDEAVADSTMEKMEAWRQVGFHRLFKGEDWKGTARGAQWERDFAAVGVEVVYLPYTVHVSSTKLRRMLDVLVEANDRR
ncbi:glycerol-3-phosphate cytidylyltransferase [Streptomyces sp. ISL-94]|uniref:glycerol-3-phosphate cytidylyltransferase n=1 Tax=Streptomyces sp. ISL-94 TaxID=2819190 RepID=UPI001BE81E29|nr:glycerol-3-phosphate cytidylyltransferase [Streptomyces sp. ISL-94]MBT2477357.1 glycerol-3-phosphate cytidylyltransferase [Streptomyces sp. ISL-94]